MKTDLMFRKIHSPNSHKRNETWFFLFIFLLFSTITWDLVAGDITTYHKTAMGEVEFNKNGLAAIITKEGWVVINKKLKVVYIPFIYDNGPDFFVEGLSRYVEKKKIGFVNEKGKVIIPAKFDFVTPFENGKAQFCNGCKSVQEGEHYYMDPNTGIWGKIDKKGNIIK